MDSAWKLCIAIVVVSVTEPLLRPHLTPTHPIATLQPENTSGESSELDIRDAQDKELLAPLSQPRLRSSTLFNRLHRTLDMAPRDTSGRAFLDSIVRETEHLINETAPGDYDDITLVTAVWTLPNGERTVDVGQVRSGFMKQRLPKVIFSDRATYEQLKDAAVDQETKFIVMEMDRLLAGFGSALESIETVRLNPSWRHLADWIPTCPCSNSKERNIARLASPALLREAGRTNPFKTQSFLFIDAADVCLEGRVLSRSSLPFLNGLMGKMLLPFRPTFPSNNDEVEAFRQPSFDFYTGLTASVETEVPLAVASMFGGKMEHVEMTALMFDSFIRLATSDGLLGSGRAFLTILSQRYPSLFRLVNDAEACAESKRQDLHCSLKKSVVSDGQCAVFALAVST